MLKLQTIDTFTCPVTINAPGEPIKISVDFLWMSSEERAAWYESDEYKSITVRDFLLKVVRGWREVDLPFSPEALDRLLSYYPTAASDLMTKFVDEMRSDKLEATKQKN